MNCLCGHCPKSKTNEQKGDSFTVDTDNGNMLFWVIDSKADQHLCRQTPPLLLILYFGGWAMFRFPFLQHMKETESSVLLWPHNHMFHGILRIQTGMCYRNVENLSWVSELTAFGCYLLTPASLFLTSLCLSSTASHTQPFPSSVV